MELILNASGTLDYQHSKKVVQTNSKWKRQNVSFVQANADSETVCELVKGIDGKEYKGVFCYNCKKPGHYRGQCPTATEAQRNGWHKGSSNTQLGHALAAQQMEKLPNNWILLDSCSTDGTTNNADVLYLYDPVAFDDVLELDTNVGQCFLNIGDGSPIFHMNYITILIHWEPFCLCIKFFPFLV